MNGFGGVSAILLINMEKATREEDREAEGMGCVFCFENDDFEPYVYCVESDEFGLTYHRFTRGGL